MITMTKRVNPPRNNKRGPVPIPETVPKRLPPLEESVAVDLSASHYRLILHCRGSHPVHGPAAPMIETNHQPKTPNR